MAFTPSRSAGDMASSMPRASETPVGLSQDGPTCPPQNDYSAVLPAFPLGPPGVGFNRLHTIADVKPIGDSLDTSEPVWPSWAEFDVDALNFSISAAISEWGLAPEDSPEARGMDITGEGLGRSRNASVGPRELLSAVQANWHTRVIADSPTQDSNVSANVEASVDDAYREGLTQRLHPSVRKTVLPSAAFLVSEGIKHMFHLLGPQNLRGSALISILESLRQTIFHQVSSCSPFDPRADVSCVYRERAPPFIYLFYRRSFRRHPKCLSSRSQNLPDSKQSRLGNRKFPIYFPVSFRFLFLSHMSE